MTFIFDVNYCRLTLRAAYRVTLSNQNWQCDVIIVSKLAFSSNVFILSNALGNISAKLITEETATQSPFVFMNHRIGGNCYLSWNSTCVLLTLSIMSFYVNFLTEFRKQYVSYNIDVAIQFSV